MKISKILTASASALTMLLIQGVLISTAHAQETFLPTFLASDRNIIFDISKANIKDLKYGQGCFKTEFCNNIYSGWTQSLSFEKNGIKFINEISSKPAHIQKELYISKFKERYAELSKKVDPLNICYIVKEWGFGFDGNSYNLYPSMTRVGLDRYPIDGDTSGSAIMLRQNGGFLSTIPSNLMKEEIYNKLTNANSISDERTRPVMKVCGAFSEVFVPPPKANGDYSMDTFTYIFSINKPIEIVQPNTYKVLASIPNEWFGYPKAK